MVTICRMRLFAKAQLGFATYALRTFVLVAQFASATDALSATMTNVSFALLRDPQRRVVFLTNRQDMNMYASGLHIYEFLDSAIASAFVERWKGH